MFSEIRKKKKRYFTVYDVAIHQMDLILKKDLPKEKKQN